MAAVPSTDRAGVLQAAIALLPVATEGQYQKILAKSTRRYVIIEKHDHPCDLTNPNPESFLWIKCGITTGLAALYQSYRGKSAEHEDAVLMMGDTVVPENGTVNDLPSTTTGTELARQILLIRAIKPESQPASQTSSFASSQGSRQPLQPVVRQLTATPRRSADEALLKREPSLSAVPEQPTFEHTLAGLPPLAHLPPRPPVSQDSTPIPGRPERFVPAEPSSALMSAEPTPKQETEEGPAEEPEREYQPRAQDNLFASQDDHELDSDERGQPLAKLANEETAERLEAGVQVGLRVLSELAMPLKELDANKDAQSFLAHIDKVRKEAIQTRTVVGVVGNTGAGKSSVINALLDEERLVPTNCMRACTAVVTELSFNHSNNEAAKYRAEIEFIKPEEWRKELIVLFKEVFDDEGRISKEISNPDSEAGVAYAKMRSVYNKKTREMLANSSVEGLMNDKKVKSVLGTTKKIMSRDPTTFYQSLQQVIDSKEKGQEKRDKNGNINHMAKREFEHWPLIKVVKIYLKSPALSTGAVIVDLPGVHDSNAARAAVAEGYMKQCTGLWIVAPINRAVDDKAAKILLGDTFKRQLKFDGTYSAVSFICSKTDDISRTEAIDSLQLGDQMIELDAKLNDIDEKRRRVQSKKADAQGNLKDQEAAFDSVDNTIEVWEELLSKHGDGKTVYAPDVSKKRKSSSASSSPRKRPRRTVDSDNEEEDQPIPTDNDMDQTAAESAKQPLTEDDIEKKLDELKKLKKEARRAKNEAKERIKDVSTELKDLDKDEAEIEAKKSAICIAGRNDYSRSAIQQDFAQGIKELDQENAEEEDPDNFNPEEELRDYEEVARTLPVFCVSSRAYQKLSGRMKKDNAVPGFTDILETEIPQLQAHAKKLTIKGRQANCRRFLNSTMQLLNSLALWASDDGTGIKLTSQQSDVEKAFLSRKLKELEKHLEKVAEDTLKDAAEELHEQLFAKLDPAVDTAIKEAGPKAESWGLPRPLGGLHWGTYRATVCRNGVFAGASGARDFNADLCEPIYKQLASVWEKTFQRRLPNVLNSFSKSATNVVKQFHTAVETRARERGTAAPRLNLLGRQLDQYSATFGDLCVTAVQELNEGQREINREFVPAITEALEPAYNDAAEERGRGSFMRMKGHVHDRVATHKQQMFQSASQQVRRNLLKLCSKIKETMLSKADEVYLSMQRDYMSAASGVNIGEIKMTREERAARRDVDQLITAADNHFKKALEEGLDELKARFDTAQPKEEDNDDAANDFMDVDDEQIDDDEDDDDGDADGAAATDADSEAGEQHSAGDAASDVVDNVSDQDHEHGSMDDGEYMER